MPRDPITLHIAEHGLLNAIETLIVSPALLGTTEAAAAVKLRLVAQILTVPDQTSSTLANLMDAMQSLRP